MKRNIILLLVAFLLTINACKRDRNSILDNPEENGQTLSPIDAAKEWLQFQNNKASTAVNRNSPSNKSVDLRPIWNEAKVRKAYGSMNIITVGTQPFEFKDKEKGFSRKYVFTEQKGRIICGYIIEIIGSAPYLKQNEDRIISKAFGSKIEGFTGSVLIYSANHILLEGKAFKNGELAGEASIVKSSKKGLDNTKSNTRAENGEGTQCYDVYWVTYWSDGSETWQYLYSYCTGGGGGGGGGGGSGGGSPTGPTEAEKLAQDFNPADLLGGEGKKPLAEYEDKCSGAQGIWNTAVARNKEVVGVLTADGKFMAVAEVGINGGAWSGLYNHDGNMYYTYPDSLGAPGQDYNGMVHAAGRYFIPITATVHTHNACLADGTDGISDKETSDGDKALAQKYPATPHYVLGCGGIGRVSAYYDNADTYYMYAQGDLSLTCFVLY